MKYTYLTILEACGLIGVAYPTTDEDLARVAHRIEQELASTPLRVNVYTERFWKDAVRRGRNRILYIAMQAKGETAMLRAAQDIERNAK